jgi:hypothetical protein
MGRGLGHVWLLVVGFGVVCMDLGGVQGTVGNRKEEIRENGGCAHVFEIIGRDKVKMHTIRVGAKIESLRDSSETTWKIKEAMPLINYRIERVADRVGDDGRRQRTVECFENVNQCGETELRLGDGEIRFDETRIEKGDGTFGVMNFQSRCGSPKDIGYGNVRIRVTKAYRQVVYGERVSAEEENFEVESVDIVFNGGRRLGVEVVERRGMRCTSEWAEGVGLNEVMVEACLGDGVFGKFEREGEKRDRVWMIEKERRQGLVKANFSKINLWIKGNRVEARFKKEEMDNCDEEDLIRPPVLCTDGCDDDGVANLAEIFEEKLKGLKNIESLTGGEGELMLTKVVKGDMCIRVGPEILMSRGLKTSDVRAGSILSRGRRGFRSKGFGDQGIGGCESCGPREQGLGVDGYGKTSAKRARDADHGGRRLLGIEVSRTNTADGFDGRSGGKIGPRDWILVASISVGAVCVCGLIGLLFARVSQIRLRAGVIKRETYESEGAYRAMGEGSGGDREWANDNRWA